MIKLQILHIFLKNQALLTKTNVLKFILSHTLNNYFEACQTKLSSLYGNKYLFQINCKKRDSGDQNFYISGTKEKRP